jgi:hypothetical protein
MHPSHRRDGNVAFTGLGDKRKKFKCGTKEQS